MTNFRRNKQKGLTLIEMMIAMILGLLVTGTILTVFISNVKSATENVKMTRLNQELRVVIGFVSDELKRAGYSADPGKDIFMQQLSIPISDCVLYAYDANLNGTYQSSEESYGFRLKNGQVQWGRGVNSCNEGNWQPLTSVDVANISKFTLTNTEYTSGAIVLHKIKVELEGEVDLNPGKATREFIETIRIRNEDVT